jgi:hypothetical protein
MIEEQHQTRVVCLEEVITGTDVTATKELS